MLHFHLQICKLKKIHNTNKITELIINNIDFNFLINTIYYIL